MLLDNQHWLIEFVEYSFITISSALVYRREVVKLALHSNAVAVMFTHNHPYGIAEPNQADKKITDRLMDALELINVNVLDHFVIGYGESVTFSKIRWI